MITEALVILATLLLIYLWRKTRLPPNFPPGPFNFPIFGSAPLLGIRPLFVLSKMVKKYGEIMGMYIGTTRLVVLNDPDLAREAMKRDVINGRADNLYFGARCDGRHGVNSAEGREWKEQRPFMIQKLKELGMGKEKQEELAHREIQELVLRLKKTEGQVIDVDPYVSIAMMNTMLQMSYGKRYEQDDKDMRKLILSARMHFGSGVVVAIFNFFQWLVYLFPKLSKYDAYTKMTSSVNKFSMDHIEQHMKSYDPSKTRDFIDHFLHQQKKVTDPGSSFYGSCGVNALSSDLQDIFIAGSDTTIASLRWALLYMVLNPQVQKKCQEEIDRVVGRDTLPGMTHKCSLPYCEATCTEVLRKAAIAPFMNFHCVLEDTELRNYTLPKDTIVCANVWHIHHNEDIWGDPHNFRPDRFITEDGEFKTNNNLVPFGAGKRLCPGELLARQNLYLYLTGLLQSLTFSLPPGPEPRPLEFQQCGVVSPPPYRVIVSAREELS